MNRFDPVSFLLFASLIEKKDDESVKAFFSFSH